MRAMDLRILLTETLFFFSREAPLLLPSPVPCALALGLLITWMLSRSRLMGRRPGPFLPPWVVFAILEGLELRPLGGRSPLGPLTGGSRLRPRWAIREGLALRVCALGGRSPLRPLTGGSRLRPRCAIREGLPLRPRGRSPLRPRAGAIRDGLLLLVRSITTQLLW